MFRIQSQSSQNGGSVSWEAPPIIKSVPSLSAPAINQTPSDIMWASLCSCSSSPSWQNCIETFGGGFSILWTTTAVCLLPLLPETRLKICHPHHHIGHIIIIILTTAMNFRDNPVFVRRGSRSESSHYQTIIVSIQSKSRHHQRQHGLCSSSPSW